MNRESKVTKHQHPHKLEASLSSLRTSGGYWKTNSTTPQNLLHDPRDNTPLLDRLDLLRSILALTPLALNLVSLLSNETPEENRRLAQTMLAHPLQPLEPLPVPRRERDRFRVGGGNPHRGPVDALARRGAGVAGFDELEESRARVEGDGVGFLGDGADGVVSAFGVGGERLILCATDCDGDWFVFEEGGG